MKRLIDLQLFAEEGNTDDEIEVIDGMLPDDEEEEITEEEEGDENDDDTSDLDDEEGDDEADPDEDDDEGLDKKTKALIKYKKEAKEAKRKLQELEEQQQKEQEKKERDQEVDKLIEKGYSETEAARMVDRDLEIRRLKQQVADHEFRTLEQDFPGISQYRQEILDLEAKYPGMSKSELYLAKFASNSQYDQKTQIEQEMIYKQKTGESKSVVTGDRTDKDKPVKLSRQDERVYQHIKQYKPDLSRRRYLELLSQDELN